MATPGMLRTRFDSKNPMPGINSLGRAALRVAAILAQQILRTTHEMIHVQARLQVLNVETWVSVHRGALRPRRLLARWLLERVPEHFGGGFCVRTAHCPESLHNNNKHFSRVKLVSNERENERFR